eukprot:m.20763 g.20763  ORF g.20763 m.20763 type:complete len:298 (-) comp5607_c0_seq1:16-909(-)
MIDRDPRKASEETPSTFVSALSPFSGGAAAKWRNPEAARAFHGIPMSGRQFTRLVQTAENQYPWSVHLAHDLLTIVEYLRWRAPGGAGWTKGDPPSWLHCLLASYFFGNGGSSVADACLGFGGPLSDLAKHPTVGLCWIASFIAVYRCPKNLIYRWLVTPRHPLRLVCCSLDAVGDVSALVGVMDKCATAFPANPLSPIMGGMLMYCGGDIFQYLDARSRGIRLKHPFAEWGPSVRRAMFYCLLYYSTMAHGVASRRLAHWYISAFSVMSAVCSETIGVSPMDVIDESVLKYMLPEN